jgi:hypothetical protein
MVIVEPIKDLTYYMDERLRDQLDNKVRKSVEKKDNDYVFIVDGEEGSGKSVFAMQLGKYLDPTLNLDRVCFTPDEFIKSINDAKKSQCIIYDEAYTGLSSRASLSEINNLLVGMMMEMRQKNLYIIIVMPTYFLLDKYVAVWRAKGLFHVYLRQGRRGFWIFFNKKKKKILYLSIGKRVYSYSGAKSSFKGRFLEKYPLDEKLYREKKKKALKTRKRVVKSEKYKEQRDRLIKIVYNELGLSLKELEELLKVNEVGLKKTVLSQIVAKKGENKGVSV